MRLRSKAKGYVDHSKVTDKVSTLGLVYFVGDTTAGVTLSRTEQERHRTGNNWFVLDLQGEPFLGKVFKRNVGSRSALQAGPGDPGRS